MGSFVDVQEPNMAGAASRLGHSVPAATVKQRSTFGVTIPDELDAADELDVAPDELLVVAPEEAVPEALDVALPAPPAPPVGSPPPEPPCCASSPHAAVVKTEARPSPATIRYTRAARKDAISFMVTPRY